MAGVLVVTRRMPPRASPIFFKPSPTSTNDCPEAVRCSTMDRLTAPPSILKNTKSMPCNSATFSAVMAYGCGTIPRFMTE